MPHEQVSTRPLFSPFLDVFKQDQKDQDRLYNEGVTSQDPKERPGPSEASQINTIEEIKTDSAGLGSEHRRTTSDIQSSESEGEFDSDYGSYESDDEDWTLAKVLDVLAFHFNRKVSVDDLAILLSLPEDMQTGHAGNYKVRTKWMTDTFLVCLVAIFVVNL